MKTEKISLREATLSDRIRAYEWLYFSDYSPCPSTPVRSGSLGKPTLDEFCTDFSDYFFTNEAPDRGRAYIIVLESSGEEIGFISYDSSQFNEHVAEIDLWMKSSSYTHKGFGPSAIKNLTDILFNKGFKNVVLRSFEGNDHLVKAFSKVGFKQSSQDSFTFFKPELAAVQKGTSFMVLSRA